MSTDVSTSGVMTDLVADLKGLGRERWLAVVGAVCLFVSPWFQFVTLSNDAYFFTMGLAESRWVVWLIAIGVTVSWALLPKLSAEQKGIVTTASMWAAVALLAYGIYFGVEGYIWLRDILNEAVQNAQNYLAVLGGEKIGDAANLANLREIAKGNTASIVPGVGGVLYSLGLVQILKASSSTRKQSRHSTKPQEKQHA
jgi:hypothetical protein